MDILNIIIYTTTNNTIHNKAFISVIQNLRSNFLECIIIYYYFKNISNTSVLAKADIKCCFIFEFRFPAPAILSCI